MTLAPAVSLVLPGRLRRKRGRVVASCPTLDVWSQGRTPAEARRNLADAAESFVLSCWRRRTLDEVLRACGLTPSARPRRVRADFEFEVAITPTLRIAA